MNTVIGIVPIVLVGGCHVMMRNAIKKAKKSKEKD